VLTGNTSQYIYSFPISRETFCDVYVPQFDTAELDVLSVFENIFDIALVQIIVDETDKYAQQEISKSIKPLMFCSKIRMWEDVTVDKMYMVLALFMLIGIVQKPTLLSLIVQRTACCSLRFFSRPLERLELIIRFMFCRQE
jgi:hypothetical protein